MEKRYKNPGAPWHHWTYLSVSLLKDDGKFPEGNLNNLEIKYFAHSKLVRLTLKNANNLWLV